MPIKAIDDYPVHQTPHPFGKPYVDDPRWFDRYWFMTGSMEERICLITGIGTYPNSNRIDAYAMLCDGERQWNLRVGRTRDDDPLELNAHGLRFEIAEPMKSWRLRLEGVDELGFDLVCEQIAPPNHLPRFMVERGDDVLIELGHYAQAGRMSGTLRMGDREFAVSDWPSERDHSWGRRTPSGMVRSGLHVWMPGQVGDRALWVWWREDVHGERLGLVGTVHHADGRSWEVVDVHHEIDAFEEVAPHREARDARVMLTLDDGSELLVETETLCPVHISGGGYVGGEQAQGTFEGREVTEFDVVGPGRKDIPAGIIDNFARFTIDGEVGQGMFEISCGAYEPLGFGPPAL